MYFGLYERESLPAMGITQDYGYSIWDYMTGNHSLLWEQPKCLNNVFGKILQGIHPYSWEQYRCLDNVFGIIWQGISPYSWEQYRFLDNIFGIIWQGITPYTRNNTGFWIIYLGLYDRESQRTLGTTQVSVYNIWNYVTGNHSLLWEHHSWLDNVFGIIWQVITPYSGNNTGLWIQYLGLYARESLPTLGTTQVSG